MADAKEKVRTFYSREVRYGHHLLEGSITHPKSPNSLDSVAREAIDKPKAAATPKKTAKPRKTEPAGISAADVVVAPKAAAPELVQVAQPVEGTPNKLAGDLFSVAGVQPTEPAERPLSPHVSPYERTYDVPKEAFAPVIEEVPVVPVLEPVEKVAEEPVAEEAAAPEQRKRRRRRHDDATEADLAGE